MALQLELENITKLQTLKDFVETIHCDIGFFGGRHFYANGSREGHVNLNDITFRLSTLISQIATSENLHYAETIHRTIKVLERNSQIELDNSNWFTRLLTLIRQHFGNKGYNRTIIQELLVSQIDTKIEQNSDLALSDYEFNLEESKGSVQVNSKEDLLKQYRLFSCFGAENDSEAIAGFNHFLPRIHKAFRTGNADLFDTALQPFFVKAGFPYFTKHPQIYSLDIVLFLIAHFNRASPLSKADILERLRSVENYRVLLNNMPTQISANKVAEMIKS